MSQTEKLTPVKKDPQQPRPAWMGAGEPVSPNRDRDNALRAQGISPERGGSPLGGDKWGPC